MKRPNLINYLSKLWHRMITILGYPIKRIKYIHELLLQTTEGKVLDVSDAKDRNAYGVFGDWIIDCLQYGTVITFIYLSLVVFSGTLQIVSFVISTGMIRWLWLNTIQEITDIIKR